MTAPAATDELIQPDDDGGDPAEPQMCHICEMIAESEAEPA